MDIQSSIKKLKELNKKSSSKTIALLVEIILSVLAIGIIFLVLDAERFISIFVLSVFFSMILSMITVFISFVKRQQFYHLKIKNTIDLVYNDYLSLFNDINQTSYAIHTDKKHDMMFKLVPSFANEDTTFLITDDSHNVQMAHTSLYNQTGEEQRRTYYFSGLYIQINDIEGDMLYRDKQTLSTWMTDALKSLIDIDQHVFTYNNETSFHHGKLYFNQEDTSKALIKQLLDVIESFQITNRIDILIQDQTLHLALSLKQMSLPHYKSYREEESLTIKQNVETYGKLLQAIEAIL